MRAPAYNIIIIKRPTCDYWAPSLRCLVRTHTHVHIKIDKVNCFFYFILSCLIADDGNARVLDETYLYSRARLHILGDNHQKRGQLKGEIFFYDL